MRYVLRLVGGDVRECVLRDGRYVHVLDSGWSIDVNDERIVRVREVEVVRW